MSLSTKKCIGIFCLIFLITLIPSVKAAAEFSVSISPTSYEVGWGESKTVSVKVHCSNSFEACRCYSKLDGNSYSARWDISPGSDVYKSATVTAPSSGQGSDSHTYYVRCNEYWDSNYIYDNAVFTINYPTSSQWAAYQAELQSKSQSESAKTAATNAINNANTAINSAQSKINEASKLGTDISSATQYINSAQSDYSSANTLLSSGNTAYNLKDYSSASSYYSQAQTKASSAQTNAANTKSMVDKIIEDYNKAKTSAQNKVSDSNSAIDTAKQRIQDADKVIKDATVIGLDTAQSKADIATSRSKLKTSEDYYSEASNLFSAGNFEGAKSKAQSSIGLADESESLATTAYNRLQERLTVSGESSKAILNANSEISQMNEILTKMDYITRSTEKWGVDLTETKSVVDTSKTNVDSAEDLLSQSKNRQASGSFDESVSYANQARDKAASSRNRLDTMTQTISLSTQDALEKAYSELQSQESLAETEVKSAQETYGATPELIIDAQSDLTEAKNNLAQIESSIEKVKSASGFDAFIRRG